MGNKQLIPITPPTITTVRLILTMERLSQITTIKTMAADSRLVVSRNLLIISKTMGIQELTIKVQTLTRVIQEIVMVAKARLRTMETKTEVVTNLNLRARISNQARLSLPTHPYLVNQLVLHLIVLLPSRQTHQQLLYQEAVSFPTLRLHLHHLHTHQTPLPHLKHPNR